MKITVKLILIIFFSIMYSQNIDLTGTEWNIIRRLPDGYPGKYDQYSFTFHFNKNNSGRLHIEEIYVTGETRHYSTSTKFKWHTTGIDFFIDIEHRLSGLLLVNLKGTVELSDGKLIFKEEIWNFADANRWAKNVVLLKSSKQYESSKYYFTDEYSAEQELKKMYSIEAKKQHPDLFLPKDEFESTSEYKQRLQRQEKVLKDIESEMIAKEKSKKDESKRLEKEKVAEKERKLEIRIAESLEPVEFIIEEIGSYNADSEEFSSFSLIEAVKINKVEEKEFDALIKEKEEEKSKAKKQYKKTNKEKDYQKWIELSKEKTKLEIKLTELQRPINDRHKFSVSNIHIPRSEARSFKENYTSAKIEGYKQLNENYAYKYFNLVVIHPITDTRFPFGPTRDIAILKGAAPTISSGTAVVPPNLSMRVVFVESNSNGFLDAEEKGRVKVSITNSGQGSAMGVFVDLKAESKTAGVSFENSKIIGEIQPGTTKMAEFEIKASKKVQRSENKFTISATESYGFPPDPMQISFETYPFIPPELEMVNYGISTPTGDNVIKPMMVTEVQARVQNTGQGEAENVKFSINLPSGVYPTPDSKSSYTFSLLKPGEFKDLEFAFTPSKNVGKTIEISIGYTEESLTGKFPLTLEVEKPQKTIQQLVVSGKELANVEIKDVTTISVDVEKNIPKTNQESKNDLAVIFGIESYKNVPGVSFAKRDAVWMKSYFEKVLGIPSNKIYYKTDSDVGQAEFSKVFSEDGWLDKRIKEGKSNVYIYYAGHGAPDMKKNKAYLIPYDGDPNYASQTGYEMDVLYDNLGQMGAKSVTVFLDACFSGANRNNEMLLADARPVFMEVEASAAGNVTVFSAAGGKEISSAWPEKKHGLFTYFLMKGMKGEADTNGDKKLTVGELGDYIHENVSDMAGMLDREQTPGLETLDKNRVLVQY